MFFFASYRRIASIQSWRRNILPGRDSVEAMRFFDEAQNDLISGHIVARAGGWRYSLKSLRSFIENCMAFIYFRDHPVELELWSLGKFRNGFSELWNYSKTHPALRGVRESDSGLELVKKEYAVLSRAVHAAASFRMTSEGTVNDVFLLDEVRMRKWQTREAAVIKSMNVLLVLLYKESMRGAKNLNHRKILGFSIDEEWATTIKKIAGVNIIKP